LKKKAPIIKQLPPMSNINWKEIPLVRVCLFFMFGIAIAAQVPAELTMYGWPTIGLLFAATVGSHLQVRVSNKWVPVILMHSMFAALGMGMFWVADETRANNALTTASASTEYVVTIKSLPRFNEKGARYEAKVQSQGGQVVRGGALVHMPAGADTLAYGSTVQVSGKTYPIQPADTAQTSMASYWASKHITHRIIAASATQVEPAPWYSLSVLSNRLLLKSVAIIDQRLPDTEERAVVKALVLGYSLDIDNDLKNAYRATGASHILAVSGMHIGLLFMFLQFLLEKIPVRSRRWKIGCWIFLMVVIWVFALVAGAGGSVLRAALMFSLFSFGKLLQRFQNGYNLMAASALFLLLNDPFLLFDLGFQLSYSAVLGLMAFYTPFYKMVWVKGYILDKTWQMTVAGIAAQLGTLPLLLMHCGDIPAYFLLSGLIAIPVSSLTLLLGFAFLGLGALGVFTCLIDYLLFAGAWLMNANIRIVESLPFHLISFGQISILQTVLLSSAIIIAAFAIREKQLKLWNMALACFCATVLIGVI
jgi:competence protein ComEC